MREEFYNLMLQKEKLEVRKRIDPISHFFMELELHEQWAKVYNDNYELLEFNKILLESVRIQRAVNEELYLLVRGRRGSMKHIYKQHLEKQLKNSGGKIYNE